MVQFLDNPWPGSEKAGFTNAGWYFWAEAICIGPYLTEAIAQQEEQSYVDFLKKSGIAPPQQKPEIIVVFEKEGKVKCASKTPV